ncbi:hypothetical protein [Novosphingobium colocasiae]|uniref:hypothetical protein n=1 Tax=Novosphingobium colocasiae TaxID=1256513 RepID=UPI0035AED4A0
MTVCALQGLIAVVGEEATVALAETFGGTRLYIPSSAKDGHPITRTIGREAARALCDKFGPAAIRVPLARELRARRYRAEGLSNARIAVRLGITEGGVRSLFKRISDGSDALQSRARPHF